MSTPNHSVSRTTQHDGVTIPTFIYGTAWKEDETERLTRMALDAGFRAIDTANQRKHYVEAAVGAGIQSFLSDTGLGRQELFLQTKFTFRRGQDHRLPYDPEAPVSDQVRQSVASSLEHLRTSYIDSYLLHGPSSRDGLRDVDWHVWTTMEDLCEEGTIKLIGISNVSTRQLRMLCQSARIKPASVQNRCYASRGWDATVRSICRDNNTLYQGFSLLTANRQVLNQARVQEIAQRHDRSVAQIVFRASMQMGMLPLTGTSSQAHMTEDLSVFDFELTEQEVGALEVLAVNA